MGARGDGDDAPHRQGDPDRSVDEPLPQEVDGSARPLDLDRGAKACEERFSVLLVRHLEVVLRAGVLGLGEPDRRERLLRLELGGAGQMGWDAQVAGKPK